MTKRSQKIILFIEPQKFKSNTPSKIGNLFMNRLVIDEDESNEILKIYELKNTEMKYLESIDDAVNACSSFGNDALIPHFLFCVNVDVFVELQELILLTMGKYEIRSTLLTMLHMTRWRLITKEKSKAAYKGNLVQGEHWWYYKKSINEDLESFLYNLQSQEEIKAETVYSFFVSKITQNELKFVEESNFDYIRTFALRLPDVAPEEMKKSDSKDKYVQSRCFRTTKFLNVD